MKNLTLLILAFLPLFAFANDAKRATIECIENETISTRNCGNCSGFSTSKKAYISKGIRYTDRKGRESVLLFPYTYDAITQGGSTTIVLKGSNEGLPVITDLSELRMTFQDFCDKIEECTGSSGGGSGTVTDWSDLPNIPTDIADGDDVDDADNDPTNEIQDTDEVNTVGAITIDGTTYPVGTDVQTVLDAIAAADGAGLDCAEIMTCFDATELTAAQITDLMSVLDFSQLTQAQKDDLCSVVQITVNSGTTATSTDNSGGEVVIDCDDILHFWNSGGAINVTTTSGSAVVDIALRLSANSDNQIQIVGDGLYVPAAVEVDGSITNEIQDATEVEMIGGDFDSQSVQEAIDQLTQRDTSSTNELDCIEEIANSQPLYTTISVVQNNPSDTLGNSWATGVIVETDGTTAKVLTCGCYDLPTGHGLQDTVYFASGNMGENVAEKPLGDIVHQTYSVGNNKICADFRDPKTFGETSESCTKNINRTGHGLTYTELTPIWYYQGAYVQTLPAGLDSLSPVGLLKSVDDADNFELIGCSYATTSYPDGAYYADETGIITNTFSSRTTPIFTAFDGMAFVTVDYVYEKASSNITHSTEIIFIENDSLRLVCDTTYIDGEFNFVSCDTIPNLCYQEYKAYIVDAAKVLTSSIEFKMSYDATEDIEFTNLTGGAISPATGELIMNDAGAASSLNNVELGFLQIEIVAKDAAGAAATVGLSEVDASPNRFTADFEFYFTPSNTVQVFRNASLLYNGGATYAVGDIFRIQTLENSVRFVKNGILLTEVLGVDNKESKKSIIDKINEVQEEANAITVVESITHTLPTVDIATGLGIEEFTVPSYLNNATIVEYMIGSKDDLYAGSSTPFFVSRFLVVRDGVTINGTNGTIASAAPLKYKSTPSSFNVKAGDVIQISVEQLGNVSTPAQGLAATLVFKK